MVPVSRAYVYGVHKGKNHDEEKDGQSLWCSVFNTAPLPDFYYALGPSWKEKMPADPDGVRAGGNSTSQDDYKSTAGSPFCTRSVFW